MNLHILITGATCNVGGELVRLLLPLNHYVFAGVRNLIEAQKSLGGKAFGVLLDFTNPGTFTNAFNSINKLFLVRQRSLTY